MPRKYLEIRIECSTTEEKEELVNKLDRQVQKLGLKNRAEYIRQVIEMDASAEIMKRLKNPITDTTVEQIKELFGEGAKIIKIDSNDTSKGHTVNPNNLYIVYEKLENENQPFEAIIKENGFQSKVEFDQLVSKVYTHRANIFQSFLEWKKNDFTKDGLLKIINSQAE